MRSDRFSFRALPLRGAPAEAPMTSMAPMAVIGVPTGGQTEDKSELSALLNGDFSTVEAVAPKYRWQAIGACPVPLRASVMRVRVATVACPLVRLSACPFADARSRRQVVFFKLLGTGVFAALTAAGSDDPITVKSCALAAAINTVAVAHYMFSNAHTLNSHTPIRCLHTLSGPTEVSRSIVRTDAVDVIDGKIGLWRFAVKGATNENVHLLSGEGGIQLPTCGDWRKFVFATTQDASMIGHGYPIDCQPFLAIQIRLIVNSTELVSVRSLLPARDACVDVLIAAANDVPCGSASGASYPFGGANLSVFDQATRRIPTAIERIPVRRLLTSCCPSEVYD